MKPSSLIYALALAACGLAAGGCGNGTFPDPNDPNLAGDRQTEVLRNNIKVSADVLYERVAKGEISDEQAQNYLAAYVGKLLDGLKIVKPVRPDKAWEYGDVYMTARRWQEAKGFYEIAVKSAKNDDRRVNDSINLATVDCRLGDVPAAIKLIRATFKTPPTAKAPILIGTLLKVVPAGVGKGHDLELAQLLEDAIPQAEQTVVDDQSSAGRAFLIARPHHIYNAWLAIVRMFTDAGRPDLAQKASEMSAKSRPERDSI